MEVPDYTHHQGELVDFLEYINMYESNVDIPKRSPRRPKGMSAVFQAEPDKKHDSFDTSTFHDTFSPEYTFSARSANSSLFSVDSDLMPREPLESALVEEYLDEITGEDEICSVDNVVTIVKCHDQWDPKKVSFIATQ